MAFNKDDIRNGLLETYNGEGKHLNPSNAILPSTAAGKNAGERYGREEMAHSTKQRQVYIYFLQSVKIGHIKIGYTWDLVRRLHTNQTGSADDLKYLLVIPMSGEEKAKTVEAEIHAQFKSFRMNGEWFRPDKPLLDFIKNLTSDTSAGFLKPEHKSRQHRTWICGHRRHGWQSACSKCLMNSSKSLK